MWLLPFSHRYPYIRYMHARTGASGSVHACRQDNDEIKFFSCTMADPSHPIQYYSNTIQNFLRSCEVSRDIEFLMWNDNRDTAWIVAKAIRFQVRIIKSREILWKNNFNGILMTRLKDNVFWQCARKGVRKSVEQGGQLNSVETVLWYHIWLKPIYLQMMHLRNTVTIL